MTVPGDQDQDQDRQDPEDHQGHQDDQDHQDNQNLDGVGAGVRVRRRGRASRSGALGLVMVVVLLAGWVPYHVTLGTLLELVGLYVLIIQGTTWNLLAGYGGLVSIGQQAYIGAGGYGVIRLADAVGVPLLLAVPLAAGLCALIAFGTSFLVFRLAGGYFAIGTWVVAEVLKLLTTQVDALGGGSGLSLKVFRDTARSDRIATVYWLALAAAVLVVLATYLLMRSRLGLALTTIRDDATAAAGLGVPVRSSRRIVYVAASAGAGLAGALVALSSLRVTPDASFSVTYTAFMIFIVVIGGIGSIEGPIIGAVVFFVLQQQLAQLGSWYLILLGAVAVASVLVFPQGLWGAFAARTGVRLFPVGHTVEQ